MALARAGCWPVGGRLGARMGFAFASEHGAGPAIARFSIARHITSADAWVAALVIMALAEVTARLVTLRLRARKRPVAVGVTARTPACEQS